MNTPFLDEIYNRVDFDRELVFKFFTIFSLFEYALKKANFIERNSSYLKTDWISFAKKIDDCFDSSSPSELKAAVDYLLKNPTKRQILNNDGIAFIKTEASENSLIQLVNIIKQTRNNLFHGGKFIYDRQRDKKLLESSLIILESLAKLNSNVEWALKNVY